jgi:hypothetical protein
VESFPRVGDNLIISVESHNLFPSEPCLETDKMDKFARSNALTWIQQRIVFRLFILKAEAA